MIFNIIKIKDTHTLLEAIDILKDKKLNFAGVFSSQTHKCIGIITLKQIFEKIVLKEFKDHDIRAQFRWNKPKQARNVE